MTTKLGQKKKRNRKKRKNRFYRPRTPMSYISIPPHRLIGGHLCSRGRQCLTAFFRQFTINSSPPPVQSCLRSSGTVFFLYRGVYSVQVGPGGPVPSSIQCTVYSSCRLAISFGPHLLPSSLRAVKPVNDHMYPRGACARYPTGEV